MEFVEKLLESKEQSNKKITQLYNGCNNLIQSIYLEYNFDELNGLNELNYWENFYPIYTQDVRYGVLFKVEFHLVPKKNSKLKKKLLLNQNK